MPLSLPPNCKIAVSLGVDFDAHSVWPGSYGISRRGTFHAVNLELMLVRPGFSSFSDV